MDAIGESIQRYPLLRLLVPYIAGIVLADRLWVPIEGWLQYGIAACGALLIVMCVLCAMHRMAWLMGVASTCFFLVLGGIGYTLSRDAAQYAWPTHKTVYEARVADTPQQRTRSSRCVMEVTAWSDSAEWRSVERKVFAYMQPCAEAHSLQAGDIVCFRGKVRAPHNFSDDLDFDYARYVTMQGAAGTVYLPRGSWVHVGTDSSSLSTRMLRLRHSLQTKYMAHTFEGDALGVLMALTLGDKRELNDDVRAAYTDAGVAHMLALSGLHVGIIYGMLVFLMQGVFRRRSLRWLREILTIAVLWLFALMVGMSASVVRAVFMCTLYILARWVSHESNAISVLSLAAFVMLLVDPLYLFDIGFQLSFMAMAAILWLEPHLEILFRRHSLHPVPAYFVGVACMSLAAQLGTLPLTLYHFGTFPTYFLLTNLVVILYLSVVLQLTVVWWVLALAGLPLAAPLSHVIQVLVEWVNQLLSHITSWPYAQLHVEGFHAGTALFAYLFILFAALYLVKRWPRGAVYALASLLGMLLTLLC